ncbi:cyclophilin peptidyl-prolyl cis-trans isomerase Cyp8 [Dimargaris verticillata]|uniref:Cyclophilin peptidyl-prolyl cis-trans isomerase Cyp8 n=1 Tax=Dimargaris verticillata TaxID=2761393 RepID=A0A9W8EF62_9FUNG|nr:cyclophilin peptidyl-prolyl cis-trans isomerase Cyp8 [Dimargaris verticillata]
MGRGTDKMYITHAEWGNEYSQGGMSFGGKQNAAGKTRQQRVPFNCCSLTLQPFKTPVCTPQGIVYDRENITTYAKHSPTDPVTGEPLQLKALTTLHYHRNPEGRYCCPVSYKAFNDNSYIVAVRPTGNVYSFETVVNFNLKAKNMRDLLNDTPFTKDDIVTLHNPAQPRQVDPDVVRRSRDVNRQRLAQQSKSININAMGTTAHVLAELQKKKTTLQPLTTSSEMAVATRPAKISDASSKLPAPTAHYSTGRMAASFTSTSVAPVTASEAATLDSEEVMFSRIKGKGYVRLQTSLGDLNLELFCDLTPRTCFNFIMLVKSGYYTRVPFHRSIKHFMIQGGDPTGTGRGGQSHWNREFPDEIIKGKLSHDKRGMLSMANHGKDTNSSQFFITFRPCKHLDGKHTVFGQLVGGMATLDKMELIPTDSATDRPLEDIRILGGSVLVDPYEEYQQRQARKRIHESQAKLGGKDTQTPDASNTTWFGKRLDGPHSSAKAALPKPASSSLGVGKYLAAKRRRMVEGETPPKQEPLPMETGTGEPDGPRKKAKPAGYHFGSFSGW